MKTQKNIFFEPSLQRVRCFKMKLLCNKFNMRIISFFHFSDKQIKILFLKIQIVMATIKMVSKLLSTKILNNELKTKNKRQYLCKTVERLNLI